MSVNFGLKTTKIISQRKAFCRQRIPESNRSRKETVDTDILVTFRNGGGKIMKSIRITSIQYMGVCQIYRDTEQPQEKETS